MEIFLQILLGAAAVSIGLFMLLSPKGDRRTRTGRKGNASEAPGCLMGFGLIVGLLAWLLSWLTGISIF